MNVKKLIEEEKCFKCGTCLSVCKNDAIYKIYNAQKGFYEIKLLNEKCNDCGICNKICPAQNRSISDNMIGRYTRIVLGASSNLEIRKASTSGGVISALIMSMLDREEIDEAFVIRNDVSKPLFVEVCRLNGQNYKEMYANPRDFASRYVSYPMNEVLKLCEEGKKYLMVGTPCQIQGARLFLKYHRNIDIVMLGIACSGAFSFALTMHTLRHYSVDNNAVLKFFYRGNGWPGYNEVLTCETTKKEPYMGSYFNLLLMTKIFTNPACKNCKDHLSEYADLSFFDYWNKDEMQKEQVGNTGIIYRTGRGNAVMEGACSANDIILHDYLDEESVIKSQGISIKFKKLNPKSPGLLRRYYAMAYFIYNMRVYKILPATFYKMLIKVLNNIY